MSNPSDWYWIVNGSGTQVYSSARARYVPTDDPTYAAWLAAGNLPSRIVSEAELVEVLQVQYPAGWPLTPAQQAQEAYDAAIATGITITCTSASPFATAVYALDATTMDQIGSVARDFGAGLGLPDNAVTFSYPDAGGTMHPLSGAQIMALYKAQRDLLFGLTTQAAVLAHGGTPAWPSQAGTIP